MNVLPDILATDSDLDSDYEESEEEIGDHAASRSSYHSKSVAQDRNKSPLPSSRENRKRQAQVSSGHGKTKARKSDSALVLPRDKYSTSSRASTGNANVGRHGKASTMHSRSAGRDEDSIKFLSAERKRLEKENREKKRRLEELRKQEKLIEVAAKKGGPYQKQMEEVSLKSSKRSKFLIHNDLAGNVFASMDRALSASSDDEEETIEGSEDQQPRQLQSDPENSSVVQSDELASNLSENVDEASVDEDVNDDEAEVEDENDVASVSSGGGDDGGGSDVQSGADDGGGSDVQSGADDNNSDNASGISEAASSEHKAETSSKAAISPVRWKKVDSVKAGELSDEGSQSEKSQSGEKRCSDSSRREISNTEKLLRYIFLDAKYYLIKSSNHENVALAQARGVWSSPPQNEARLNRAFRSCSNVILVFSVKESRRFQGFARLATESDKDHPPIRWVLPAGMPARSLSGVFTLDWINRNELSFAASHKIKNTWNENYRVQVGRDGQIIEPVAGEALCRLFPIDQQVDLHAIALKSREAMDKRGVDPHELYKKAELRRRRAKTEQRRERRMQKDVELHRRNSSDEAEQYRLRRHSLPRRSSTELHYGHMRGYPRRRSDYSEMRGYPPVRDLLAMPPMSPPPSFAAPVRHPPLPFRSPVYNRRPSFDRPRSFSRGVYERSKYFERRSISWDRRFRDRR